MNITLELWLDLSSLIRVWSRSGDGIDLEGFREQVQAYLMHEASIAEVHDFVFYFVFL